jgi:hypothetical protein
MVKKFALVISMMFILNGLSAQDSYDLVFQIYRDALEEKVKISFKEAVFHCENAYFEHQLHFEDFNGEIGLLSAYSRMLKTANTLNYDKKDKEKISTYAAIFLLMTDTVNVDLGQGKLIQHLPYSYDFDDIFGSQDWTQTFITKLLESGTGNCHSMPYLYKILCDELNVPCHLALAPNHIYIKHRAEKGGWYNTELTSASFPIDAWLMASGYISLQAVQNGIYLDTLSEKESIALCVLDLAQGYNHKYPDNDGKFVIECCDLALKHFPDYVNAILLKAETRLKQLQVMQKEMKYAYLKEVTAMPEGKAKWDEMNSLYMQLYKLGYRQMPEQMYVEWLTSLKTEKEKYSNKNAPGATKD